jgi:hypothetical protein
MSLSLPDRPAVHVEEHGLAAGELDAVLCALSRWCCDGRTAPPGPTWDLGWMLAAYARQGVPGHPAARPELKATPRHNEGPMRRAGLTREDYRELWEDLTDDDGVAAALPADWIAPIVDPELWPVVLDIASDGPQLAVQRFNKVLTELSRSQQKATAAAPAGSTSRDYVRKLRAAIARLHQTMSTLRDHPSGSFAAWHSVAELKPARGREHATNKTPPDLRALREAYGNLEARALDALGHPAVGAELAAVQTMAPTRMGRSFRALRNWAMFTCLVVTASRADAFLRWTVGDVVEAYPTPAGVGPVILHRPGKTLDAETISVKPLGDAWRPLSVYLAFLRRRLGELPAEMPLWIPEQRRDAPALSYAALRCWLSGSERQRPLIAVSPSMPMRGFPPHRFRAAAYSQLYSTTAARYLAAREIEYDRSFLATALADHSMRDLASVYNVVNTPEARAGVAAVAIDCLWQLMTTDEGLRRGRDRVGFLAALRRLDDLAVEDEALDVALDEITRKETVSHEDAVRARWLRSRAKQVARETDRLELDLRRIREDEISRRVRVPDSLPDEALRFDPDELERRYRDGGADELAFSPQPWSAAG